MPVKEKSLPELLCGYCEKPIGNRRHKNQKYCDVNCYGLDKRNRTSATCKSCGEAFEFKVSQRITYRGAGQFCSKQCSKNGISAICLLCNAEFNAYNGVAKYCSLKCRQDFFVQTPVDKKVRSLSANLRMGKGKKEFVKGLIAGAIDTNCPYCKVQLTILNISLDHKIAINSSKLRRGVATEERRYADRADNLQIICRACNAHKSNFDHEEYLLLLEFLEKYPIIKKKMFRRLSHSGAMWSFRRK